MKAKPITVFAAQFGARITLNTELVLEKTGRYFLVDRALKPFSDKDFFYIGIYLGKAKGGKFFPSFNLLSMLAKKDSNRIVVDRKAAWLFICGRDVLGSSIIQVMGSKRKNTNTLVLNEFGECLGFGRIIENLCEKASAKQIAVRSVLDIGDFLRRERY